MSRRRLTDFRLQVLETLRSCGHSNAKDLAAAMRDEATGVPTDATMSATLSDLFRQGYLQRRGNSGNGGYQYFLVDAPPVKAVPPRARTPRSTHDVVIANLLRALVLALLKEVDDGRDH